MKRRKFIKDSAILGAVVATPLIATQSGLIGSKSQRKIHKIMDAGKTMVGTLPILRAFAGNHLDYVSPYVLLDEFGPVPINPGDDPLRVDAHPHAGVIPTTYFLNGSGHHKDSLDYDFQIEKGDFMMFNSGKGAIHMEETGQKMYEEGGQYHGFQIWLNMPSKYKFSDPTTGVYDDKKMATIDNDQFNAKIILGAFGDARSSIELLSPAFYYHIKVKPNGKIDIPTAAGHNAFIYSINGRLELEGQKEVKENQLVLFERGAELITAFSKEGAEFLLLGGQPLDEVVYSYGPFVMNTEAQIRQCIQNYQSGKMGNPDRVN